jgi:multidrug efflux pump subunit AcrA (membrane-fusion protein)
MWMKVRGKIRLSGPLPAALGCLWLLLAGVLGTAWNRGQVFAQATPAPHSLILSGQLSCSLRRAINLPFPGTILSLKVQSGDRVEAGTVLARYRLAPEASLEIHSRLANPTVKDLEIKLAEVEKNLFDLKTKQRSLSQLARENLASPVSLNQVEENLRLAERQKSALNKRLVSEQQLAQEYQALIARQLGPAAASSQSPQEAELISPIQGYVIWIHPDLRENAELAKAGPVFLLGVMDPMLVKAQVHEIEAMQLTLGDRAEVSLEALPGRKFEARVSRLSWASLTAAPDRPSFFDIELTIPNSDLLLKEGLKARLVLNKSQP